MNAIQLGAGVNHYPRHIGDYLKKTLGLTMLQDGAYNRAIDLYYSEEQELPRKPDLYLSLRCQGKADRDAVDHVLAKYFEETPTGYRHDRCEKELEAQRERSAKAAKGAMGKWGKQQSEHRSSMPRASPEHDASIASAMPASSHKPVTKERSKTKPSSAAPPDLLVSAELWQQFRENRRAMKAPLTEHAEGLLLNKLRDLASSGHDPTKCVEQSIERGWKGLFPIGAERINGHEPTLAERRAANIADITGRTKNERTIDAGSVDRAPVLPVLRDLRKPNDGDVG